MQGKFTTGRLLTDFPCRYLDRNGDTTEPPINIAKGAFCIILGEEPDDDTEIRAAPHYYEAIFPDYPGVSAFIPVLWIRVIEDEDICLNQFGYYCPKCGRSSDLSINAVIAVSARLLPDQVEEGGGDCTWADDDDAWCNCGWEGTVADLLRAEEIQ